MGGSIVALSNTAAKSLAGRSFSFDGRTYRFQNYDPAAPGQPPWRSGAEGKAFPLLDERGRRVVAYLKFFTTASSFRHERTLWLIAQQVHKWVAQLGAAPSAWVDTRLTDQTENLDVRFTGALTGAAPGVTWLELKSRIALAGGQLDHVQRWQCVRDLLIALGVLEYADIVHGDLSPQNILVDVAHGPVLSLIDFDAFVARRAGAPMALPVSRGGTFGTVGYCPVDLEKRSEEGDDSLAPYSDRHSRDMLMLELLFFSKDFSYEDPPALWEHCGTALGSNAAITPLLSASKRNFAPCVTSRTDLVC